jgi:hypothetical protein
LIVVACRRSPASTTRPRFAHERAGFRILRQGKHIVMTNGARIITIPRGNPLNAFASYYE